MATKRSEHRIDVRVFVRTSSTEEARKFAQAVDRAIEQMAGDFLRYKVSLTGSHVEVETL